MRTKVLSLCIMLMLCFKTYAAYGLVVIKWGGEVDTRDTYGVVTPPC